MNEITSCICCGQCCIKGGPTLHNEDIALIQNNILGPKTLFTIRKGEPVYHPVEGRLVAAPVELIKIKGITGSWACIFFDNAVCAIYEDRPLECRIFKCWDTRDSIKLFMRDTISRKTIIQMGSLLDQMISTYEDSLPASIFMELLENPSVQDGSTWINKCIEIDQSFRNRFIEHFGVEESAMDFFFGRPFKTIVAVIADMITPAIQ